MEVCTGTAPQNDTFLLCCICGTQIPLNTGRMCVACLREEVDVTEGISRQVALPNCKQCERYLLSRWMVCEPESKQMLALCLKKIRGLSKVKLIDASFIWTEPHSKRLRVKITVQKEAIHKTWLQQTFTCDFVLQSTQCDDCKKTWTPHTWNAVVQVRQRTDHKRSFMYLEQLILKYQAHEKVIKVEEKPDGIDFQFENRQNAMKFGDFIGQHFPVKIKVSRQMVSHDATNNTHHSKHTFAITLSPICKDDLVFLPPKVATVFGTANLMLCTKVSTCIHLIDPLSLRSVKISAEKYWKNCFTPILTKTHLCEFTVLNVEKVKLSNADLAVNNARIPRRKKCKRSNDEFELQEESKFNNDIIQHGNIKSNQNNEMKKGGYQAIAEIARSADLGKNDERLFVTTHLGNLLKPGDICLGYDLRTINLAGRDHQNLIHINKIQTDAYLVKKHFKRSSSERSWVLKNMDMESGPPKTDKKPNEISLQRDIEMFKQEIEENEEMRKHVNLFRNPTYDSKKKKRTDVCKNRRRREDVDGEKEGKNSEIEQGGPLENKSVFVEAFQKGIDHTESGDYLPEIQLSELLEDMTLEDDEE